MGKAGVIDYVEQENLRGTRFAVAQPGCFSRSSNDEHFFGDVGIGPGYGR